MSQQAIDLYEHGTRIHPRAVVGKYQQRRVVVRVALLLGFFLTPYLQLDGRQAVWIDLPSRHFHVFALTFYADDVYLATGLLIVGAFLLFAVTNYLGRVWCGFACPQSVWFSTFIALEEFIEGNDRARRALDAAPWTGRKVALRLLKYGSFLSLSLLTAVTAVGYFEPIRELLPAVLRGDFASPSLSSWTLVWIAFFFVATFVAGGLLREQVCFYMCPYARFQSAMFDAGTVVVAYDRARGEPRASKRQAAEGGAHAGDCVDCELCVRVCPVGIDIRDGLQYRCIHCAMCIDACDGVMSKLQRPLGLVRYASETELAGKSKSHLRPRLLGYTAATLVAGTSLLAFALQRPGIDVEVMRERTSLFREVYSAGEPFIENGYRLHITNKTAQAQSIAFDVQGLPIGWQWQGDNAVTLQAAESTEVPVRLWVPEQLAAGAQQHIEFIAHDPSGQVVARRSQRFFSGRSP